MREYYVYRIRYRSREFSVLWFSDEPDGVLLRPDGRFVCFAAQTELVAYAKEHALNLLGDEGDLLDLDWVSDWCKHPAAETLICVVALDAWNFFGDVGASAPGATRFPGDRDEYDALN